MKCDVPLSGWQILERYGFVGLHGCGTYITRTGGLSLLLPISRINVGLAGSS
jgi:hypothetical protein